MLIDLKPCPFCGKSAVNVAAEYATCGDLYCVGHQVKADFYDWNVRSEVSHQPVDSREAFERWFSGETFPDDAQRYFMLEAWQAAIAWANKREVVIDGWQPIETAPKDGTPILAGTFVKQGMTFCGAVIWESPEEYFEREGYRFASSPDDLNGTWAGYWESDDEKHIDGDDRFCTHWMPLPKPPLTNPTDIEDQAGGK